MGNSDNNSGLEMVAFVACSGCAAGKERFAGKFATCAEAVDSGFVRGECRDGCVGVGSCVSVCKQGAMRLEDGKVVIDREKCNGCGDCVGACPQGLIRMIPADATNFIPCSNTDDDEESVRKTCGYGCIACGECERSCPQGAVSIVNNHAVIDYDKCVGCSACTVRCKKKIIVDTLHDLRKLKEKVAFVRCSGGEKIQSKCMEKGIYTCEEAAKIDAKAEGVCTTGCCGFGSCVLACRYDAISVVNGTAVVDPDKCVGCRDCTFACPKKLITMVPYKGMKLVPCMSTDDYEDKAAVCDSACIACEDCVRNCPNGAIYMEDRHAVIDPCLCEDCNMCQYVCRRNIIKAQQVPEYIYDQHEALKDE
ncbi:MAG: 4Fe-4S binding protein [Lachnospiraceae bacterium]|nr:4Fe-4S binding protein [Lachnospiraceae bacterium]